MTRIDWLLLPLLTGVLFGVVCIVFALVGYLGLGVLGLLIGFVAQRIEIEKEGAVGHPMVTSLYAQQAEARQRMTRAERAEHRAEMKSLVKPLFVAKVVSAGLIILGFGFFFLFQLP
ncbi:hypothetical protein [Microvirga flavescens]|uniref:hypothetical protein n=1 Tax=Microvirga flavescens TaxID=2249811 RepID=UPI001300A0A4|nr:hypothetical protein [Microvirga flavescens]